jgi:hypothetical protein
MSPGRVLWVWRIVILRGAERWLRGDGAETFIPDITAFGATLIPEGPYYLGGYHLCFKSLPDGSEDRIYNWQSGTKSP